MNLLLASPRSARNIRRRQAGGVPENLHVHVRLECDEEVRRVVRVDLGAAVAQVLRAVCAVEPLAADVRHAAVAHRELVGEVEEVSCSRLHEYPGRQTL